MKHKVNFNAFSHEITLTFYNNKSSYSVTLSKDQSIQIVDDMISQIAKESEKEYRKAG